MAVNQDKTHPKPANESSRLKALEMYNILDTEAEERFDRLTLIASTICETPIALVSLLDENRQWFKSRVGLDAEETPREISFCQHAIMGSSTFEIENATLDKRFQNNVLVTGDPNIRFYAGHPLIDSEGHALGTLCVIDRKPKKLSESQRIALTALADEVAELIEDRIIHKELSEFKKFFQMSLDFLCIAGTDGYFKAMNPTFTEKLGYTEQELLSKPFVDFIHPEDVEATILETHKLAKGYTTIGFENRYRKSNGDYIWLHWTCQPDTNTGELFAVAHDISELKNAKQELTKTNEQLDEFAYVISHDLKAPLRAISTLSEFLEEDLEGQLDGDSLEHLKLLKSRVIRMDSLINGVLEYSRIGRKEILKEEIDTSLMLRQLSEDLSTEDFKISIDSNIPNVFYPKVQLHQIFQNLISNAIKYHDKDHGTVKIHYCDQGEHHQFTVKDDGPGIENEYHEKIFTIFQTLQPRDKVESTGIGLSIVKKIIHENDGKIWVESALGKGSEFHFTVPKINEQK